MAFGAPDRQAVGVGVGIGIAQEEGVFRLQVATPDGVIGHDRRFGAGSIGQTGLYALGKYRISAAAFLIGAGRRALPHHREGHTRRQQHTAHGAQLRPPVSSAHKAQQHHEHSDSHKAHAEGLDGLGDVTVAPIYIDAVLIFGRNANEQRRGRQQRQTGQKQ